MLDREIGHLTIILSVGAEVSQLDTVLFLERISDLQRSCDSSAFKPRPTPSQASYTQGTKQYQLRKYAEQTLGSGNLRNAVVLPEGEEAMEWIAVHGK
jgi:hypothetical protein